jgi:hypothetical protein
VGVKINDDESDFFLTRKGLRQGDPIDHLLFNCVIDVFSRMLVKGTECGLIRGLCPQFIPSSVVCLQYADNTLLFLEKNVNVAFNLKWTLACFEQISGMRINFHKSDLIPINIEVEELQPFIDIFQCEVGSFPVKYLGIPLHFDRLKREDLQHLIESILRRITRWRGKLISTAAKRILIQACLSSIPIYLLSFFRFPKWALSLLDTQLENFMWNDEEGNHKTHLANWPSICMKKEFGGMGIQNLQGLNLCLIGSWIKRYIQGEGSLWKKVIVAKYNTRDPNFLSCLDVQPSTFWKGVMWVSRAVAVGYRWKIGNEKSIKFWEDILFGNSPLAVQFWDLYFVSNQ